MNKKENLPNDPEYPKDDVSNSSASEHKSKDKYLANDRVTLFFELLMKWDSATKQK